jgi:hypothetical protein
VPDSEPESVFQRLAWVRGAARGVFPVAPPSISSWERSLRTAIRSGTVFREIISSGWVPHAQERLEDLQGAGGMYEASRVSCDLAAFLNFYVLVYKNGSKEVFFGWVMSPSHGFDQPCIRTSEPRVVQLFENWHADLFAKGEAVANSKTQPEKVGAG